MKVKFLSQCQNIQENDHRKDAFHFKVILESPMTREDLETSPKTKLHIPINQSTRQPASERLREYLKGLEKKLESVSTMVDGPQSGGKRWESSHRSTSHMTSSSKT